MIRPPRILALGLLLAAAGIAHADEAPPASPTVRDLPECVAMALANHPSLGSASASVDAGQARVRQAVAGYLPFLDARYDVERSKSPSARRSTSASLGRPDTFTLHSADLTLSQVLFDFGRNLESIRAARERGEALELDEETARRDVVFGAKQAYFQLLAARRLLEVAEETLSLSRAQRDEAERRYAAGLAARLEVTRSKIQEADAESDRLTARNNLALARATLGEALGLEGSLDFEIADRLGARAELPSEDAALERAFRDRSELESATRSREARSRDATGLGREHWPAVNGSASYGWAGDDTFESSWSVGLDVVFPLFHGGATAAQVAEAEADVRALDEDTRALQNRIALEARQALLDARNAEQQLEVNERAAGLARENLELASGRYHAGVSNVIELTDAQVTRATVEAERVQSLYRYQITLASLERAIGTRARDQRGEAP